MGVFDRVVCGVDGSEPGRIAARVAARVTAPEGRLVLVGVDDPSPAVHAGWGMPQILSELERETLAGIAQGAADAAPHHRVETQFVRGDRVLGLLNEIDRIRATLVVVGTHGRSRAGGIVLGAVSTTLLHDAPCPVLVARGSQRVEEWPRRIAVGVDGSGESAAALEAARELAARLDVPLRTMVATQDAHVDLERVRELAPDAEEHDGRAIDVFNVASETADLVVVGSRGLRGVRALGSLSERLAHEARSSVLVIRPRPEG